MAHSRYLRQMARSLRAEQQLTVDELAARLALPRSTIYYWVRDLPLREGRHREPGTDRPKDPRPPSPERDSESAYEEGLESFDELAAQPTFRDFVCLYLLAGEQRDRTCVALTNSDPAVMRLASRWLRRLTDRAISLSLQCAPGQSLGELRRFWGEAVGAEPRAIRARRHGGREDADGRPMAGGPCADSRGEGEREPVGLRHGLLTVAVEDTLLRARLQAWMQRTRESWR